jgi:hypothetical protein
LLLVCVADAAIRQRRSSPIDCIAGRPSGMRSGQAKPSIRLNGRLEED